MHPAEQKIHDDVRAYGWHIIWVFNAEPEFAYTIGLHHTFGHPEIIVFGLPREVAHGVLNAVGKDVRAGGVFASGARSEGIVDGYEVVFKPVPQAAYEAHLGWALWYYGAPDFPVLQLVYPDRDRRFPWEADVADGFRASQPVLDGP